MSDDEIRRRESTVTSDYGGPTPDAERDEDDAVEASELRALEPGDRIGRYEIRALLGSGGMGRVYAARDPTLEREVAIKALAHSLQRNPHRMKRLAREAKVLAALSHPNIAAIYGFEEHDGAYYLVLEKVDGGDLARKTERGPLPLKEALAIAAQVADGLAEAHAKGVIHRDLKPSNVMLTSSGRVKLVDFGVAKSVARRPAGAAGPQLTVTAGLAVGTAPYMSPEQVGGEPIDERTDIWAFGCLLYEMLAGCRAFRGASVSELLVAILRDGPDFDRLPPTTPPAVRWLIERCLQRDPAARPRHIVDLRVELLELLELATDPAKAWASGSAAMVPVRRSGRRMVFVALGAAAGAALAALATIWLLRAGRPDPAPAIALSLELPYGLAVANRNASPFAFAPDGSALVVEVSEGNLGRLHLRRLDEPNAVAVTGTENAQQPFFSPDGAWIGFFAQRKLAKVPIAGGTVVELGEFGSNPRGATWLADGTIVLAPSQTSALVRVSESGGRPSPLTTLDAAQGESSHRWPEALPGGRFVLFTVGFEESSYDEARLELVSVETGERRRLLDAATFGRYAPSGHLLFVRGGRVYAVELDLESLTTRGAPQVVVDGVRYDVRNGAAHLALSSAGAMVYDPGLAVSADTYLSWLRSDGLLKRLSETPRVFRDPRPSPDGERVAVVVGTARDSDLRVLDESGTSTQLSFGLSPHRPTWSPDGRRVIVSAERDGRWGLFALAVDGSGKPELLFDQAERIYPCDWTPDGRALVFQQLTPERGWDLELLPMDEHGSSLGEPSSLAATPFQEAKAVVSPDGRWLAYESDELDGTYQIYARALPVGDRKIRVSTAGARWPSWSRDGVLAYWDTGSASIRMARILERDGHALVEALRPPFPADAARPSPYSTVVVSVTGGRVSIHPAGDRFLVLESSAAPGAPPLSSPVLLSNWSARLRSGAAP